MNARIARHTAALEPLIGFYTLLGMEVLGSFEKHNGYDGVMLGFVGADWHLEFTTNDHAPQNSPDPEDGLVLYFPTRAERDALVDCLVQSGLLTQTPPNPYWQCYAVQFSDPDGHAVLLALRP